MKEGLKGRASGLKDMIGRIPDMAMNLFDWAGVEMTDLPKKPDGTSQRRSIWDAWLGTSGGKPKLDLLTGEATKQQTTEEPYHRLGSLNFKSLERDFHGTFAIMQWLMGNAQRPTGVYIDAMKTDFKFDEDFSLNELKKKIKYIGIVMNEVVLTQGSPHLYVNPETSALVIQKNFFRNLMSARIRSASFAQNILGATIRPVDPTSGATVEVSQARVARLFIDEASKDSPIDEETLISHYVDSNYTIRRSGSLKDVEKVLEEATFDDRVGRVVGRKIK
jgi:hypothetical protein